MSGQSRPNTGWKQPHNDISHDNDKKRNKKKFLWFVALYGLLLFHLRAFNTEKNIFILFDSSTTQVI